MDTSFRKRFFAWMLQKGDSYNHRLYGDLKKSLSRDLSGKILEIGHDTRVNFKYLPNAIEWIGVEPKLA